MGFLSLLSNLVRALSYYWELRAKQVEHDVREMSRTRIEALEDQLEDLRNAGSVGASLSADRVRDRLIAERAYFKHLPSSNTETGKGRKGND